MKKKILIFLKLNSTRKRVDMTLFSTLSAIRDPRNLRRHCGRGFGVFLNTKRKFFGGTPTERLKILYNYTGMDWITFPKIDHIEKQKADGSIQKNILKMENMLPPDTSYLPSQVMFKDYKNKVLKFNKTFELLSLTADIA